MRCVAILQLGDAKVEGRTLKEDVNMRQSLILQGTITAVMTVSLVASSVVVVHRSDADDTSPGAPAATGSSAKAIANKTSPVPPKLPEPKDARRLSKDYPIWIDPKERAVIVEGQIAL